MSCREGDYLGTTVNVAARLVEEAERHQLLTTAAARNQIGMIQDAEFVPLGKRHLRGLVEDLELFALVSTDCRYRGPETKGSLRRRAWAALRTGPHEEGGGMPFGR